MQQNFLFDYRSTKHTSTSESPAKLMLRRKLKTRFSLLKPFSVTQTVEKNQNIQVENYKGIGCRSFIVRDTVIVRNYTDPNKKQWEAAKILKILENRNYLVELLVAVRSCKRHVNQIRSVESNNARTPKEYKDNKEITSHRVRMNTTVPKNMLLLNPDMSMSILDQI